MAAPLKATDDELRAAAPLLSQAEIALFFGMSVGVVSRRLRRLGVRAKGSDGNSKKIPFSEHKRIAEMLGRGLTLSEIARVYNVKRQAIWTIKKKLGLVRAEVNDAGATKMGEAT